MNYYEHHIGDYDADTAHLSWAEDMAYARLLRLYYRRERAIPADVADACRLVRATTRDQRQAVESVLREFFELREDGWHQSRCDAEIAIYQQRVAHNQRVGKLGGRPRKTKTQDKPAENPPGSFREPGNNPPQTPDPRPHTPLSSVPDGTGGAAAKVTDPNEIIFGYGLPLLTSAGTPEKQARSFLGGLRKSHGDTALIDKLRDCIREKPLQPLEWLAKALPPPSAKSATKHGGFENLNYREGINADGTLV